MRTATTCCSSTTTWSAPERLGTSKLTYFRARATRAGCIFIFVGAGLQTRPSSRLFDKEPVRVFDKETVRGQHDAAAHSTAFEPTRAASQPVRVARDGRVLKTRPYEDETHASTRHARARAQCA
jgi:hypothetical protein